MITAEKFIYYFVKNLRYNLFVIFFILINFSLIAQDINAHSPKPLAGSHQQQVADKKKQNQKKQIEIDNKKSIEKHMKLQAKNTKKMMRKSRRTSKQWNDR